MDKNAKLVQELSLILGAILIMSDDVRDAASPLDMQGKLLRLHNSIQKNAPRIRKYASAAAKEVAAADAAHD